MYSSLKLSESIFYFSNTKLRKCVHVFFNFWDFFALLCEMHFLFLRSKKLLFLFVFYLYNLCIQLL